MAYSDVNLRLKLVNMTTWFPKYNFSIKRARSRISVVKTSEPKTTSRDIARLQMVTTTWQAARNLTRGARLIPYSEWILL